MISITAPKIFLIVLECKSIATGFVAKSANTDLAVSGSTIETAFTAPINTTEIRMSNT
jgi:hypothetical protein